MSGWLEKLLGKKTKSALEAKERLKLVLIHDRIDLTPDAVEAMKKELLQVILKYVDIESDAVNITVAQEGREQRLVADIPLKSTRKHRSS
jgi:cell division topological specificity factor